METELQALFQAAFGAGAEVTPLRADGSARKIYRLRGGGRTVVGVANADRKENAAFTGFSRHFRAQGLAVPEIYAEDAAKGIYLEQDLGDTTLFDLLSSERGPGGPGPKAVAVYEAAVRELPRFQISASKGLPYGLCYPRSSFDKQSMAWDLNYFKYYFLKLAGIPFDEQALEDDFERFSEFLLAAPRDYFLYRDFQSRNIMVVDGKPWFIDYQGGRRGALQYDVASLLFDAKADLPGELRERLLGLYLDAASELAPIHRSEFLGLYHGYVYIRIMQAMGAYGLRGFYERKSHFLQSIPYAVRNLEQLLAAVELPIKLPALMGVFQRLVASASLRQFGKAALELTVKVESFSYRNGIPNDDSGHGGGFVFDCRALPNPGRFVQYSKLDGRDREVIEFLEKTPEVPEFLEHVRALVDRSVETYKSRNFTALSVAFGCTGGQHRSVYCAEQLARHLRERHNVRVQLSHRSRREAGAPA